MGRREWCSMICDNERDQLACLSWFKPLVPEEWGMPIAADVEEDIETGRDTAIRALFRTEDGKMKEAVRRTSGRNVTISFKSASASILQSAKRYGAIT